MIKVEQIAYQSEQYQQACRLRETILRQPLGLMLSDADVAGEQQQLHFAAFEGDRVCASCILKPLASHVFELRQFAVDELVQGKGFGRALIHHYETYLRKFGTVTVEMSARVSAKSFYERNGYIAEGDVYEKVGIPHIHMSKVLLP